MIASHVVRLENLRVCWTTWMCSLDAHWTNISSTNSFSTLLLWPPLQSCRNPGILNSRVSARWDNWRQLLVIFADNLNMWPKLAATIASIWNSLVQHFRSFCKPALITPLTNRLIIFLWAVPAVRAENQGSSGEVVVSVWSVCFCRKLMVSPSPASAIQPRSIPSKSSNWGEA